MRVRASGAEIQSQGFTADPYLCPKCREVWSKRRTDMMACVTEFVCPSGHRWHHTYEELVRAER